MGDIAAADQVVPRLPPQLQAALNTDHVPATALEYDSARIYLAKWAADLAARSEQDTPLERRYRHVGIWGHGDAWEEETALGVFEVLNVSFKQLRNFFSFFGRKQRV